MQGVVQFAPPRQHRKCVRARGKRLRVEDSSAHLNERLTDAHVSAVLAGRSLMQKGRAVTRGLDADITAKQKSASGFPAGTRAAFSNLVFVAHVPIFTAGGTAACLGATIAPAAGHVLATRMTILLVTAGLVLSVVG